MSTIFDQTGLVNLAGDIFDAAGNLAKDLSGAVGGAVKTAAPELTRAATDALSVEVRNKIISEKTNLTAAVTEEERFAADRHDAAARINFGGTQVTQGGVVVFGLLALAAVVALTARK